MELSFYACQVKYEFHFTGIEPVIKEDINESIHCQNTFSVISQHHNKQLTNTYCYSDKMKIILIYFFLFAFLAENTLGFSSIIKVKGLSLPNLSLYLLLLGWAFNILIKRKLFEWNSLNKYLILFIFLVILSIPYKILLDEIPDISLKQEIIWLKNWVEPFIIFFIMFNILDDKNTCKKALLGLGILLLITALSGPLTSLNIVNLGRASSSGRASRFFW